MHQSKVLILGAGPSGLTVASQLGSNALILERSDTVGGLCQSIEFKGAIFDLGGHSFHTPYKKVGSFIESLMKGEMLEQKRDARVWISNQLIPYPFQHHYHLLNDENMIIKCQSLNLNTSHSSNSSNFQEWLYNRFGAGICDVFMFPYNRKLWARDLSLISCEWVDERIVTSEKTQQINKRNPLQKNSSVSYPSTGGFGRIFEELAKYCKNIRLKHDVSTINLENRTVSTVSGECFIWERLVSTLPLPIFLRMLDGCNTNILSLAEDLEAVSLKILLISTNCTASDIPQRLYIAGDEIQAHKIAFNHTSSSHLSGMPNKGIVCEISYSHSKPAPPDDILIRDTWRWLQGNGFVHKKSNLNGARVIDLKYGYPVYTSQRAIAIKKIHAYLANFGIYSIGRFGSWAYLNSDGCMHEAFTLVDNELTEFKVITPNALSS